MLGIPLYEYPLAIGYKAKQLKALMLLLMFRDAWWKIAGWEQSKECYFISSEKGEVITGQGAEDRRILLTFPTEEMRDKFSTEFRALIKHCIDLL